MASSLRAQLEDDAAHHWDVTPKIALAVFLAPFVGAAAVVLARADKSFFRFLTREDSLLEWAQFVGFAAAGVLAALAGRRLLRQERSLPAITFFVFALGCFAIAGEEISWGQRLFEYDTPERLEEINEQRETTVHNIGSVQDAANIVFALVGLYGSVGAWLLRLRRPRWALRPGRRSPDSAALPDLQLLRRLRLQGLALRLLPRIGPHSDEARRMARALPRLRLRRVLLPHAASPPDRARVSSRPKRLALPASPYTRTYARATAPQSWFAET